jgi:3D-(3,5/4)-trihydroxycyclohexane-1,2-dione acylhydrolase (decyclizing)
MTDSVAISQELGDGIDATSYGAKARLTAAQAIVRFLEAQWSVRDGVTRRLVPGMFGIWGHGNLYGIGQALEEMATATPLYTGKNEQSMVHAAIGFAKASRRLQTLAVSASVGPGSTNMISGAATATVNRLPVLLFPSDTFANRRQGPILQGLEPPLERDATVNDAFRPVSRFFDRISRPEQLLSSLPEAMRVLLDPAETGAVTVSLHQDVQGEAYDYPVRFFEPRYWDVVRRPAAESELVECIRLVRASTRPLLVAGGGVMYSDAQEEVATLSELFGIPVAETMAGKGALPGGSLSVGGLGLGGTRAANLAAAQADLVVAVGTRLNDVVTGSQSLFHNPDVRFIGINVNSLDAHKQGAHAVVADAKLVLTALIEGLRSAGWATSQQYRTEIESARDDWLEVLAEDLTPRASERMSQAQVLQALNADSRPGDVLVGSAGTVPVDVLKLWDCADSAECHIEFGFSCMGHDIPAAMGYRLARPDAGEIYAFMGDGNYLLSNPEIVTAVQERWKVTVIVVENGGFQSIRNSQVAATGVMFGTEFRHRDRTTGRLTGPYVEVDYAANARSLGCAAYEASTVEEFVEALAAAREETGPTFIVVHVEPHRLMLGSDAWWDVGMAEVSGREQVSERGSMHRHEAERLQRFHY